MERTYPYKAWKLSPSFKPIEVELVKSAGKSDYFKHYDLIASGRAYHLKELFATKHLAIDDGWSRIAAMQAKVNDSLASISKKRAALQKALGEIGGAA